MTESELLAHIAVRSADLATRFPQVVLGPGDDCAVIRTPSGDELLLTTDHLVAGRHYEPGTPIELIARKAVARSVSDIAAMGGTPAWSLATACLPRGYPHADELFAAMKKWAEHWGCPLVGGDLATFGDEASPLVLTVTVGGHMGTRWMDEAQARVLGPECSEGRSCKRPRPVRRAGGRAGDGVYVTGSLGQSVRSGKHLSFEPRLRAGELCAWSGVHAMIDLSDGLGRDGARIARASGVVLELDAALIPLNPECGSWQDAVRDGEDYELLVVDGAAHPTQGLVTLHRIGQARACDPGESAGVWVTDPSGERHEVSGWGWDHE